MKPLFVRLCVLGFLGIASGISVNALFLQDTKYAHFKSARQGQELVLQLEKQDREQNKKRSLQTETPYVASVPRKQQLDAKIKDVLELQPVEASPQDKKISLIKDVQSRLIDLGYWPGQPDGILGPTTKAAIMAFELDKGFVQTGIADDALLRVLKGETALPARTSKPDELAKNSQELVLALQKALTKLGYNTGQADGIIGPLTRKRIRAFERDHKLQVTGRVSGRLVEAIHKALGTPLVLARL